MKIKGVIFDMDGLMFDTERLSAGIWAEVGKEFGLDIGEEFLSDLRGAKIEVAREKFLRFYGPEYDYMAIRKVKDARVIRKIKEQGVPVKDGLPELLPYLKQRGCLISLATSTPQEIALDYLKQANVSQYFDQFVCGDMVKKSKPDPDIFLFAAEKLKVSPVECMVLEDSVNGVLAGLAGGFVTVMVPDLAQPSEELRNNVFAVCDSLKEIPRLFEQFEHS